MHAKAMHVLRIAEHPDRLLRLSLAALLAPLVLVPASVASAFASAVTDPLSNTTRFAYDAAGNQTRATFEGESTHYRFDANHRLAGVERTLDDTPLDSATYAYDADLNRIGSHDGATRTRLVVDTSGHLSEVVAEFDTTDTAPESPASAGTDATARTSAADATGTATPRAGGSARAGPSATAADPATVVTFVHGEAPYSRTDATTTTTYFHADALGSTRALTDERAAVTARFDYDPWGNRLDADINPAPELHHFAGGRWDEGTGRYHLRLRDYAPEQGRFTQLDPFAGLPERPLTLHRYAYANLDPANVTDPTGAFGLIEFDLAFKVRNVLAEMTIDTGVSLLANVFDPEGAEESISAKQTGVAVLLSLVPASSMLRKLVFRGCRNSFAEGTLVHAEHGLVPIEDVRIGDLVWSVQSGREGTEVVLSPVIHVIRSPFERTVTSVRLDDGTNVLATAGHSFYSIEKGWSRASDLDAGDSLRTISDRTEVFSVDARIEKTFVHNLTISDTHTYFVGQAALLAHNANKCVRAASRLPVVQPGSRDWDRTVQQLSDLGKGKRNLRVPRASDALALLQAARGSMNRYKNYKRKGSYNKGYEVHNYQNSRELDAGIDLQHIKWKDGKAGGHIYYD